MIYPTVHNNSPEKWRPRLGEDWGQPHPSKAETKMGESLWITTAQQRKDQDLMEQDGNFMEKDVNFMNHDRSFMEQYGNFMEHDENFIGHDGNFKKHDRIII